ncbi:MULTISPECIES: hypothetical protein [Mycolicibacterium]|jgi:hypothetical protein|uniref:Uncharacterized protein n=1 Tax=Mycolicibacterium porcinum TaxID=39693 RepID=A0AAW5T9L7_9MYCO|nr:MULTISPECIES: hypothetical protein [Mycolicibacterium]MBX8691993.1 hypothetical protein [Mycobacterium sp. 20091114027_K0903767]MCV7068023.1 hypothetical protein [Mycolicibacterium farcinogenes]CDO33417.1 hypothetical protein BN979_06266 [Mycolicibacterium vulneris]MCV7203107.1 hypothetical protein [Mycolicibacterium peregrinum]MCV7391831.1 hypothetical protein [Mycolicibacterium porcinum]
MSTANEMLPPQASPIDRTPAGAAAFTNQAGVGASFDFPWEQVATTGIGILGGLL